MSTKAALKNERACVLGSPLGRIRLVSNGRAVVRIDLGARSRTKTVKLDSILAWARQELVEYFRGDRKQFSFPIEPSGTSFQLNVWRVLKKIPYGEVISYAELAKRVGKPRAARAVGSANGKNPLPIVIPCHRVIASDGKLGGFSAGLRCKRRLLSIER